MFTGLIEAVGTVTAARKVGSEMELCVDLAGRDEGARIGASIALSGVCCTVTRLDADGASFWLSAETLRRTWFGSLAVGRKLNVERCLRAGQEMGGHIVQGHVDGVGRVLDPVGPDGGVWRVEVPAELERYCVEKGSIALDGVSLTIAALDGARLSVAIIPHTAQHTTIGALRAGDPINVEVDVLAKYVERLLAGRSA
ncbi:MAG: riboflavin synthase [Planctomycetota bacterium]